MIEAAKKWMLAELNALSITGSPKILSASLNSLPSGLGIFVSSGSSNENNRNIAESQEIRIVVQTASEQSSHTMMREIAIGFRFSPGESRNWNVDPATKNLKLRDIQRISMISPESQGIGNVYWRGIIVFRIIGSDSRYS